MNDSWVRRGALLQQIEEAFRTHPVVALLGPRQCGKTSLARQWVSEHVDVQASSHHFDLEHPTHLAQLDEPYLALKPLHDLVVIDEIQRLPSLFPILRVLVDEPDVHRRFLILGSASRTLIQQSSESLAGRIRYIEVTPFSFSEVSHSDLLWWRGGFPRSYLASSDSDSFVWRQSYVQTFLEQDIPNLGIRILPDHLRRFWMMLAHYHGQLLNASELGRSLGVNHKTIRDYLDILSGTFMVRELQPWFENISKRQIKSSKIYIRDTGLFHFLLGVSEPQDVLRHPKLGASWEGFALEEILKHHQAQPGEYFFWSTQADAELDLLIFKNGKRYGFEFKYTDKPRLTKSMHIALQDLNLEQLTVISPGEHHFVMADKIQAQGLAWYLDH